MAFTIDGTNGLTFNNATTQASAGQVLQVVQGTYSTITSSTTNTWANTGITTSITPKFSTSKILATVFVQGCTKSATGTQIALRLNRGSTTIITFATNAGDNGSNTNIDIGTIATEFLDSPATTSSTTYTVQLANDANAGTVYINNNYILGAVTSTITLMEIAA
jgi:hypothetical protein